MTTDHFKQLADILKPEVEKCVLCGAETPYVKETPIELRFNYIEGAGQLCQQCYNQIKTNQN